MLKSKTPERRRYAAEDRYFLLYGVFRRDIFEQHDCRGA
jgi:hypothetical protein